MTARGNGESHRPTSDLICEQTRDAKVSICFYRKEPVNKPVIILL